MKQPKVVVIVDGPDPDNYICILAAISPFVCFDVVAVIMTGRPVSATASRPGYLFNPHASRAVRRDNALHAKGILVRHGGVHIPVFEGLRAPYSTVPHDMHIHERVTDLYDDAHAGHALAGTIDDAVVHLAGLGETIHVICGGPLTDLEYLMRQPMLHGKLGLVTAQLGMFGFGEVKETMAGGRKQFNALADPQAAYMVLNFYPQPVCMIPTDITKDPGHAFSHPNEIRELAASGAFGEIADMYQQAWPFMWEPRGEKIFTHDFHPVELMNELLRNENQVRPGGYGRYTLTRVGISHVPHLPHEMDTRWGEIDLGEISSSQPPRFLVDGCDTSVHREVLASMLNTGRDLRHPQCQPS